MPYAPKSPCSEPGCPATFVRTPGGPSKCPAHLKAKYKRQDATRPSFHNRGYVASIWNPLRIAAMVRDGWRCQGKLRDGAPCGWEPDIVKTFRDVGLGLPGTDAILEALRVRKLSGQTHFHIDHIETARDRPDLMYTLNNLNTLCSRCHNAKTMRESVSQSGKGGGHA